MVQIRFRHMESNRFFNTRWSQHTCRGLPNHRVVAIQHSLARIFFGSWDPDQNLSLQHKKDSNDYPKNIFERLWSLQSPNTLWNPFLWVGTSLNSTTCFLSWIDLPLQAPLQLFAIPGPLVTPNLQTVTVCQGLRQSHCDNRTYQSISYCCWPKSLENPSQQPQHHVQAAATVRHRHHPESRSDWIEGGPGDVTVRMCNWI